MKKTVEKFVIIYIFILCFCVFPISLVRKNKDVDPVMSGNFGESDHNIQELKQIFVAQTGYLEEISFDVRIPENICGGVYAYV